MPRIRSRLILAFAAAGAVASSAFAAGNWAAPGSARDGTAITVSVDHADGLYGPGEKVVFTIRVSEGNRPLARGEVLYEVVGNGGIDVKKGAAPLGPQGASVTVEHKGPICLTLAARYKVGGTEILYKAGAVVDPNNLRPIAAEPNDFDAFWAAQRKKLAAMPLNAKLTAVLNDPTANAYQGPEVESFDVQADCPGGAPLSAYFSRPKNAKPKSLPAIIHYHSAGVHSSDLKLATSLAKGNQLAMDMNAHGILNGQPEEYYKNLLNTTLRRYGDIGLDSRETCYLLGMYLRIMRSIEFLASQAQWDGKTIIAEGTSQGGGQALIAAGLDPRVTLVSAGCPTFCNLAASSAGQAGGFPFGPRKLSPKELETVRYFDACYHITRAKSAATFRLGVIDETCWPAGMFAAYNLFPGKKFLVTAPTTHSPWCSPEAANQSQAKEQILFRALRAEALTH